MIFESRITKVDYYNYGNPITIPIELKPCPFCGGVADMAINDWDGRVDKYRVRCASCGAGFPEYRLDPRIAASEWNNRILYGDTIIDKEKDAEDD